MTTQCDRYKIKILFTDGHTDEQIFENHSDMDEWYEFFKSHDSSRVRNCEPSELGEHSVQEIKVYRAQIVFGDTSWLDEIVKSGDLWYKSVL